MEVWLVVLCIIYTMLIWLWGYAVGFNDGK